MFQCSKSVLKSKTLSAAKLFFVYVLAVVLSHPITAFRSNSEDTSRGADAVGICSICEFHDLINGLDCAIVRQSAGVCWLWDDTIFDQLKTLPISGHPLVLFADDCHGQQVSTAFGYSSVIIWIGILNEWQRPVQKLDELSAYPIQECVYWLGLDLSVIKNLRNRVAAIFVASNSSGSPKESTSLVDFANLSEWDRAIYQAAPTICSENNPDPRNNCDYLGGIYPLHQQVGEKYDEDWGAVTIQIPKRSKHDRLSLPAWRE